MAAPQASSRLEMLQARFQQKQLQEKEQKLLQLYDQQQQRAYQVVQRGSAGSNSSNHGSTIRTTTTHTTSTSQGGKVRQMFDERRQTSVKGIDRSYPLEPLENKLRKQAANSNGVATQRNGNLAVNRQSVTVKRVARADVNSNVNGGKPVVSYHEETSRESFGPSVQRHDDENEFGVENRVATFANGYHRHDLDNEQEEALDQETIERNRMMAKIHLMGFDESLKHRVRNDLESEEFPEYLMADVPDKLPKRSVTKKLSQAEARLERFKNANAKRTNVPKQSITTNTVIKKRSEQTLPTRSNFRKSEIAGTSPTGVRSGSSPTSESSQRNSENVKNPLSAVRPHIVDRSYLDNEISKKQRESFDIETAFRRRGSSLNSFEKATKTPTTSRIYTNSNYFKSLTSDGKIFVRRTPNPPFFLKRLDRSDTPVSIDEKNFYSRPASLDRLTSTKRGTSARFFRKKGEKSATTMSIDRENIYSRPTSLDRQTPVKRSTSPQFFCREDEKSATTMSIDRKNIHSRPTSLDRQTPVKPTTSPQFFRREGEKSVAAMSIDRKNVYSRPTSLDRQTRLKRSTSPQFFCREDEKSATTMSIDRRNIRSRPISLDRQTPVKPTTSPQFFRGEDEKSAATMSIDRKNVYSRPTSLDRQTRLKRSTSPQFFCREDEKSATTMSIDRRNIRSRPTSLDRQTPVKPTTSPQFFRGEDEKSAATMSIDRKNVYSRPMLLDRQTHLKRSTSPQFFCREGEKLATTMSIDRKNIHSRSTSLDRQLPEKQSASPQFERIRRTSSPQFFCKESEKSATTMLIEPRSSSMDSERNTLKQQRYTSDTSYKRPIKSFSPIDKKDRFAQDRHSSSPPAIKREAKKNFKDNEVFGYAGSETRRSSKISETSATSASSIVSLKYGLEFDNIFQSAGLVRKVMKSQKNKQREVRQSSPRRNVRNASSQITRDSQRKSRYKTPPFVQKSRSPSIDSRKRSTSEYARKSITPTEVDMEIQEITMTDHRIERYKPRKASSPTSKSQIDGTCSSSTPKKIISPTRGCGRQHDLSSKTPTRLSLLGQIADATRDVDTSKTPRSRGAVSKSDRSFTSKFSTYTIRDRRRDGMLIARKGSADSLDRTSAKRKAEKPEDKTRELPTVLAQKEKKFEEDIKRMDSVESALRRFDSIGTESEHSVANFRASPEISLRMMNAQTKTSSKELIASGKSTTGAARDARSDATLKSTARTPINKGLRVKNAGRKSYTRVPGKEICLKGITRTLSSIENKQRSTQRRSPTCRRRLFEFDSRRQNEREMQARLSRAKKTQKKEDRSVLNVRSRKDEAASGSRSAKVFDRDATKESRGSEETSTIFVKPLRSIEDIRRSIRNERSGRSKSAIANWRSASPESVEARRSLSAADATRHVLLGGDPARLTKVKSCVSRNAKSPSPDTSAKKQNDASNTRTTRGSAPSSPSKSPDIIPRRTPAEPRNQEAKFSRRSTVAKSTESIGSKMSSGAVDTVDGAVRQNGSLHESPSKKSDAFVIDFDDRPKESDVTSLKKVTPVRKPSSDKYQATSNASGQPVSSSSSGVSATQPAKNKMAMRVKTPNSGSAQAKGSMSSKNSGSSNSTDNLTACNICGRRFAQERISLHEQICAKTINKKRKQFDAMMFRVKGTELEPFVKKGNAKKQEPKAKKPELKSNWRRKHEEFIQAIRSAKLVQSHLAAGGNLKDLPPPPPSDTSDYIQCPHCGRKFNQAAAERHIPKCEHMLHNKPAHARMPKLRR